MTCAKFSRRGLICTTFCISIGGLIVLGFGIWGLMNDSSMQRILGEDNYLHSAALLLVIAGAVGVFSFIGCIGAWKRNRCLIMTYLVMDLVILVLVATSVICGIVFKNKFKQQATVIFKQSVIHYDPNGNNTDWNDLQKNNKCCGYNSPTDWTQNEHFDQNRQVPVSCCKDMKNYDTCKVNSDLYYADGCKVIILEYFNKISFVIGIGGGLMAAIMIIVMTCSIIVFQADDYERY